MAKKSPWRQAFVRRQEGTVRFFDQDLFRREQRKALGRARYSPPGQTPYDFERTAFTERCGTAYAYRSGASALGASR